MSGFRWGFPGNGKNIDFIMIEYQLTKAIGIWRYNCTSSSIASGVSHAFSVWLFLFYVFGRIFSNGHRQISIQLHPQKNISKSSIKLYTSIACSIYEYHFIQFISLFEWMAEMDSFIGLLLKNLNLRTDCYWPE